MKQLVNLSGGIRGQEILPQYEEEVRAWGKRNWRSRRGAQQRYCSKDDPRSDQGRALIGSIEENKEDCHHVQLGHHYTEDCGDALASAAGFSETVEDSSSRRSSNNKTPPRPPSKRHHQQSQHTSSIPHYLYQERRKKKPSFFATRTPTASAATTMMSPSFLLFFFLVSLAYFYVNLFLVLSLAEQEKNDRNHNAGSRGANGNAAFWVMSSPSALGEKLIRGNGNGTALSESALERDHLGNLTQSTINVSSNSSSRLIGRRNHRYAIPNVLTFTHNVDLLRTNLSGAGTSRSADDVEELKALQANVRRIVSLHPGAAVRFLTDDGCVRSIRKALSDDDNAAMAERLVVAFSNETAGMFKADLCRGAALLETGGLYFDVDLGVRQSLFGNSKNSEEEEVDTSGGGGLLETTTFATVRVHAQSKHPGSFFQAFIAATPRHPVILEYLVLFDEYYRGKIPSIKGKPLGVVLLKRAYDRVLARERHEDEGGAEMARGDKTKVSLPTSSASLSDTTEIWQEVPYNPDLKDTLLRGVPPPTWGTRRACKFVVIATASLDPKNLTVRWPISVPFYSRIAGSRMCPPKKEEEERK